MKVEIFADSTGAISVLGSPGKANASLFALCLDFVIYAKDERSMYYVGIFVVLESVVS